MRRLVVLAIPVLAGCAHTGWRSGVPFFADPAVVASALGDPPPRGEHDDVDLPVLAPPHHERSCCAFGMDLRVDFAGMHVPFFEVGNVLGVEEVAHHAYTLAHGAPDTETNGLVYTCRGGWIDLAHVREEADDVVFLALTIAPTLEQGSTVVIAGHGAPTTVEIVALPAGLVSREGRMRIATTLAAWATFRISIWHEVSTWYGYQSVAGFSEQPSAFSPEDLYSNALGIRLGVALALDHDFRTEEAYDAAIESFIEEALRRLGGQPRAIARDVMSSLDGAWWDSSRRLPDDLLVTRRRFPPRGSEIAPWRAEDAFARDAVPAALDDACRTATTRALTVPDRVGGIDANGLVSITWLPDGWADATLPFPDDAVGHVITDRDLDALVAQAHTAMALVFGAGFDEPGPR